MKAYTDESLLKDLRNQEDAALRYIYHEFYPMIEVHVLKNSGTREDARDLFHDAILILYHKLKNGSIQIHTSLRNYVFGICKYQWIKQLELKSGLSVSLSQSVNDLPAEMPDAVEDFDHIHLIQTHFSKLSEDCQRVLRLYYDNASLKEIADIMGYKNEKYAKKKKCKCKERLVSMIRKDPRYRQS